MNKPIFIYGLRNPKDQKVRYVGKTVNPHKRLIHHICMARKGEDTHKARWVRKMLAQGIQPEIVILETTDAQHWQERERHWIAKLTDLVNTSAGGDGVDAPRTPQWTAKIGKAHKGKSIPAQMRDYLSRLWKGRNDAGCKNGHPWTEENTVWTQKKGGRPYRQCRICRNEAAVRRNHAKGLKGRTKAVCRRGHPLTPENIYEVHRNNGRVERVCKTCHRLRDTRKERRNGS